MLAREPAAVVSHHQRLDIAGFARQQFRYGRGAYIPSVAAQRTDARGSARRGSTSGYSRTAPERAGPSAFWWPPPRLSSPPATWRRRPPGSARTPSAEVAWVGDSPSSAGRRTLNPALSFVVLTDSFDAIADVVERLVAQEDAASIELVIACPDESALSLRRGPIEPLAGVTVVKTPLLPEAPARAAAVHAARAPVVVLGETHVFAEPEWAGRLLRAHEGPWVAVAPGIGNANPAGGLSWVGPADGLRPLSAGREPA